MGQISALLEAAAGEASLHSRLGKWRRAVSEATDRVGDVVNQLAALVAQLTQRFSSQFAEKNVSAGAVTVGVGANAIVNTLTFDSTSPNEKVVVSWTGSRSNTSGAQVVRYEVLLDGAIISSYNLANADSEIVSIDDLLTAAAPGLHRIEIRVAESALGAGVETVEPGATLVGLGLGVV
jgi:hypothetical protein